MMYWNFIEKDDLELYLMDSNDVNSTRIVLEGYYSIDCRSEFLRYSFDIEQTKFKYRKDGEALKIEGHIYPKEIDQYFDVVYSRADKTTYKYVDFKYFIDNFNTTALEETMYSEGGNIAEIITFEEFFTKLKIFAEPILVSVF